MIAENKKISPFHLSNQGEKLDTDFFIRLRRFEKYFKEKSNKSEIREEQLSAIIEINNIFKEEFISYSDIKKVIEIYNQTPKGGFKEKPFWFDLRLHIQRLAFIYGRNWKADEGFNMIEYFD